MTAAQEADPSTERTITVNGTGDSFGDPDMARITLGVERANADIATAYSEVNETIDAIITSLTDLGISADDIQTTDLSIFTEDRMPPAPQDNGESQRSFRVQNRVTVMVRDLDNLEEAIDAAVNAGANNVFGLNFTISDRSELEASARVKALEQAQDRAQQIADALSVPLGQVQTVVEEGGGFVSPAEQAETMQAVGGGGAVVERGQLAVTVRVRVTYRIGE